MILSKLVLHHEAVKLKAMGFNIPVTAYYHELCGPPVTDCVLKDFNNANESVVMISAPTIEVAEEWLNGFGKLGVANLAALVQGQKLSVHQRANAVIEFNKLLRLIDPSINMSQMDRYS